MKTVIAISFFLGSTSVSLAQTQQNKLGDITNTGQVGVGTTTPGKTLHVVGTNTDAAAVLSTPSSATADGVDFTALDFTYGSSASNKIARMVGQTAGGGGGHFYFQTPTGGGTAPYSTKLVIRRDGNVLVGGTTDLGKALQVYGGSYVRDNLGVGTSSPITKFEVKGTIFSSNIANDAGIYISADDGGYGMIQATNNYNSLARPLVLQSYGGNVAIGSRNNDYRLTVSGGDVKSSNYDVNTGVTIGAENTQRPRIGFHVSDNNRRFKIECNGVNTLSERLGFFSNNGGTSTETEVLSISKAGTVGIGTTDTKGYMLAVKGDAVFTKVKVQQYSVPWPDYVFQQSYKLPSLQEVETFIKQHNHLPDVPSAAEVEKEGLDVGDNQAALLKKIEELTLYVIDLHKQVSSQHETIKELKKHRGNKRPV